MKYFISLLWCFFIIASCKESPKDYIIHLHDHDVKVVLDHGKVSYLRCFVGDSLTSSWPLRYPVFQFQAGDVNGDGVDDIAVGVIKKTRYDSIARKRLFLFQVRNNAIIPLWLGSALSHPLENFTIIQQDSAAVIRAIEKDENGQFLVAEYEWLGFGLNFKHYLKRNLSLELARQVLNQ